MLVAISMVDAARARGDVHVRTQVSPGECNGHLGGAYGIHQRAVGELMGGTGSRGGKPHGRMLPQLLRFGMNVAKSAHQERGWHGHAVFPEYEPGQGQGSQLAANTEVRTVVYKSSSLRTGPEHYRVGVQLRCLRAGSNRGSEIGCREFCRGAAGDVPTPPVSCSRVFTRYTTNSIRTFR